MAENKTVFLIAGTASGVGKTTMALAVMAALRARGLVAQPFKGGPDFLETGDHRRIAERLARTLDTWMGVDATLRDGMKAGPRRSTAW